MNYQIIWKLVHCFKIRRMTVCFMNNGWEPTHWYNLTSKLQIWQVELKLQTWIHFVSVLRRKTIYILQVLGLFYEWLSLWSARSMIADWCNLFSPPRSLSPSSLPRKPPLKPQIFSLITHSLTQLLPPSLSTHSSVPLTATPSLPHSLTHSLIRFSQPSPVAPGPRHAMVVLPCCIMARGNDGRTQIVISNGPRPEIACTQ